MAGVRSAMTLKRHSPGRRRRVSSLAARPALCDPLNVAKPFQYLRESIRFVFLDRDGVLNRKMPEGSWVTSPACFEMLDGAAAAIAALNRLGIRIIVVTNQRGIAAGLYSEAGLSAVHEHMRALLVAEHAHLDAIYYCPHDRDACDCRKPKPGMLLQAFADFPGAGPGNSLMIGDSLSDIKAGRATGMATVFIDGDASTQSPGANTARSLADYCSDSLASFVQAAFG